MLNLIVASALLISTVLDTKAFGLPTDPPDCATDYWAVGLEIFSESFSSAKKSHAYGTPYEYIDKDATCRALSDQIYDKFDTFYNTKIVSCATNNPSYLNTYVSRSDLIISECKFIKQVDPELSGTEWYWYQIDVQQGMECCRQLVSPSPTPWMTTPPPTPSPSPSPSPTPSQSPTYSPEPSPTYSVSPTSTPSPYPSPS